MEAKTAQMLLTLDRKRAISQMIAALILIAIVVVIGIAVFALTGGFVKGGAKASLSVVGTGVGSDDGSKATLQLIVRNDGDGVARIHDIYVEGAGGASPTGVTVGIGSITGSTTTGMPTASTGTSGYELGAKKTVTIPVEVTGTGLYPGATLRVYVVYDDVASNQASIATAVINLG